MAKFYRKSIRINGEVHTSPRFRLKKDADEWYTLMRRKKQFLRDGFLIEDESTNEMSVLDWARTWIKSRMNNYPAATWKADEQRLRDYVLPELADNTLSSVTANQIRATLKLVSDGGKSIQTRNRVQSLLSALFSDAFNHDPPLIGHNPVLGIKLKDRRIGKAAPSYLETGKDCEKVLTVARKLGIGYLVIEALGMMAGLRKQELGALKWNCVDRMRSELIIREKIEQASLTVKPGTKGGEKTERRVPVPKILISILDEMKALSKFNKPVDFILARESDGRFLNPRDISRYHDTVIKKAGVKVTVHGLRHTFGREFAEKSGNMKALQAILGHSSSAMTDRYSDLAGDRLSAFGEVVRFDFAEKPVKRGRKR